MGRRDGVRPLAQELSWVAGGLTPWLTRK